MYEIETPAIEVQEEERAIFSLPLLDLDCCAALLRKAEAESWHPAYVVKGASEPGIDEGRVSHVLYELITPHVFADVRAVLKTKLKRAIEQAGLTKLSAIHMIRYQPGNFFGPHRDAVSGTVTEGRRISVVCYLNDDFEGGATYFPTLERGFQPKAGRALVFPSWYLHEGQPVTRGSKTILSFFLGAEEVRPDQFEVFD